jgi:hypothetical protein
VVVYVLIALAVVAFLYGGYRVLGGAAARVIDPDALLREARDSATRLALELSDAIAAGADAHGDGGRLAEAAQSVRRRIDGCAQQLERLDPAALEAHDLVEAHALIAAAVEDLSWAARMCATSGYAGNPGLRRAVDELCESADRSLLSAARPQPR